MRKLQLETRNHLAPEPEPVNADPITEPEGARS